MVRQDFLLFVDFVSSWRLKYNLGISFHVIGLMLDLPDFIFVLFSFSFGLVWFPTLADRFLLVTIYTVMDLLPYMGSLSLFSIFPGLACCINSQVLFLLIWKKQKTDVFHWQEPQSED